MSGPHAKMDWLRLETRLRESLSTYSRFQEDPEDTLREIDDILAEETRRGNELPCRHCGQHPICSPDCPESGGPSS